jgi:hypothetical protein
MSRRRHFVALLLFPVPVLLQWIYTGGSPEVVFFGGTTKVCGLGWRVIMGRIAMEQMR